MFLMKLLYALPRAPDLVRRKLANFYWARICRLGGGVGLSVGAGCTFMYPSNYRFEKAVKIESGVQLTSEIKNSNLTLAEGVQLSKGVCIDHTGSIAVGRNTLLSKHVTILSHSHGKNPRSTPKPSALQIGEDVWIGQSALIMDTVKVIGSCSVIAAGSVLTKDVGEGETWAGIPAKPIGRK